MLNIVIPMAGRGSRFSLAGYSDPKPLISVFGEPMIKRVIENVRPKGLHKFIFIAQLEHNEKYGLSNLFSSMSLNYDLILIDYITRGAAETVMLAKDLISTDAPLMIANSDQWIDFPIDEYLSTGKNKGKDCFLMTMKSNDPKWSYVKFNERNDIIGVVEKQVVSEEATVGIYNFKRGLDFVKGASEMITNNELSAGEFYVAPVYTNLISKGLSIEIVNIGNETERMFGLGTPNDLTNFLTNPRLKEKFKDDKIAEYK